MPHNPKFPSSPKIGRKKRPGLETMHIPNPLLFLLLLSTPFTASLRLPTRALEPNGHTSAITKINTIIDDLSMLNDEVAALTGASTSAQSISAAAGKLNTDLNLATAGIVTSTYSVLESAELRVLVVPLGPIHTSGLAVLISKAPLFAALGVTTHVGNRLLQLSLDNNSFWTVLGGKLVPGDRDAVEAAGNQTRAAYRDALAVF
ncbi:hypothetical protein HOY80DRAFT_978238 [Tuber brumale]|nr:hypothetical protein HOY80DRAFT_978238 [Tuber brumale]